MGFELEQPLALLLFIPVLIAVIVFVRSKLHLSSREKLVIVPLRILIFTLLAVALAMPNLVFTAKEVHTVFIMDRSDSNTRANSEMTSFIREAVSAKGEEDAFAIVSVGRDAVIERMISSENSFSSDWSRISGDYTNLESALQLSTSLLAEKGGGRIVIMSDGNETAGDALHQASIVREQGITVDTVPFFSQGMKDVSMKDLQVPRQMFKGEKAAISVTVESTEEAAALLQVMINQEAVLEEVVELKEGTNSFSFTHPVTESGTHHIRSEVFTDEDSIPENNQLSAMTIVGGSAKVLLVEGDRYQAGNALYDALVSSELDVERVSADFLPGELNNYLQYESIIFSNVPAMSVSPQQMEIIEKAVRDFGVGFIMTGGMNSFALGGYKDTPIETILPVEMEIKSEEELPSLGMVFVIDRSGSMMGQRLELAKEAAARSVELLREGDTVGVVAFDDQIWPVVETAPMEDIGEVTEKILGITAGGGTDIYPGLAEGYRQLETHELQRRHIILLTDGESPETGDYKALIEGGLEDNITLSAVAVGADADHYLLEELAEYGAGRFYAVFDESTMPSILSRETMLATRTYIEDNPFYPKISSGTSDWTPAFMNGVPRMNAYIATTPKGRATNVLTSEKEDPVLSRWQYGLGKTVAWTSDVDGAWSGDWAAWENWAPLWNDIVTWTFSAGTQDPFELAQRRDGMTSVLTFTAEETTSKPLDAAVVDERGSELEASVRMTKPGEYEVSFEGNEGMHFVQLTERNEEQTPLFQTGVTVSYPEEYELKPLNDRFLEELADRGDGAVIGEASEAFRPLAEPPSAKQSIAHWLILAAFLLFFTEVGLRRFGVPRFSFARLRGNSGAWAEEGTTGRAGTIGELKSRKAASFSRKAGKGTESRMRSEAEKVISTENPGTGGKKGLGKKAGAAGLQYSSEKTKGKDTASTEESSQDRMKRLLEAKKRRGL